VPLFKEQIAIGGPVTLTDERMTRYFMSVREAAELIIQASALSDGGDILFLEMGEPVRIRDLAEDMISLAGLTIRSDQHPEGDIEIVIIGAREGEKLHEKLIYDPSGLGVTLHPKILKAKGMAAGKVAITAMLSEISECIDAGDEAGVRQVLFDRVIH
jgi:FlaA1/EpsC-like NDP-sugar epimerase